MNLKIYGCKFELNVIMIKSIDFRARFSVKRSN